MFTNDIWNGEYMSEAFLKALKWFVLVGFVIAGTAAFQISGETGSNKPIILGVLSYGVVYIMSYFWNEFRGKTLLWSMIIFFVLTFASSYTPDAMFVLFDLDQGYFEKYYTWVGTVGVLGVPAMALVFYKYD